MVELAPNHKWGLSLDTPILIGSGVIAIGEPISSTLRESGIGAIVIGPISYSSRRGSSPPRLAEVPGGFVLDAGLQNRGARASVNLLQKTHSRVSCPLIAQIAERDSHHLQRVAQMLEGSGLCHGLELLVHSEADRIEVAEQLDGLHESCELPVWVKLPFGADDALALCAIEGQADALVVSQPPLASYIRSSVVAYALSNIQSQTLMAGYYSGLGLLPQLLDRIGAIARLQPSIPVILSGGIHSVGDVDAALAAGATAVQLDGVLWVEPGVARMLVRHCQSHV